MDAENLSDLINDQILQAQVQFEAQNHRGENTEGTRILLRSLRLSLRAFSSGVDLDDEAATSFILLVSVEGQVLLRRDSHLVELFGPYFESLLRNAGVVLVPGQALLVEPEFAKRVIEESLGEVAAEESRLERKRADLLTAHKQSAGTWREFLLQQLKQLASQSAALLLRKIELANLNGAATDMLKKPGGKDAEAA
jgi:hypothetical protein